MKKKLILSLIICLILTITLFKSCSKTETWVKCSIFSNNSRIRCIAINSIDNIFIGTSDNGLFVSKDNGNTWTPINIDLYTSEIEKILFNKNGQIFIATNSGILKSKDDMRNWEKIQIEHEHFSGSVNYVTINSKGHIYIIDSSGLAFRTEDDGITWIWLRVPIEFHSIIFDSIGNVYATTWTRYGPYGSQSKALDGLIRSTDNGVSWFHTDLKNYNVFCAGVSKNGNILAGAAFFNGLFISKDNGESWEKVAFEGESVRHIFITDKGKITVYLDETGFFQSDNNCKSWFKKASFDSGRVTSFITNSKGRIFALTKNGLYKEGN